MLLRKCHVWKDSPGDLTSLNTDNVDFCTRSRPYQREALGTSGPGLRTIAKTLANHCENSCVFVKKKYASKPSIPRYLVVQIQIQNWVEFEFVPRNLSLCILRISGVQHFQWKRSYEYTVLTVVSKIPNNFSREQTQS